MMQRRDVLKAIGAVTLPFAIGRAGPVEASVEQIQKFAALFPKNARPLQKRNRRFVIDAS